MCAIITKEQHLKSQIDYIKKIQVEKNDKNKEYTLIKNVRDFYNSQKFTKEELKNQLILLENKGIRKNADNYSEIIISTMSVLMVAISIGLSINNSLSSLNKYVSELANNNDAIKKSIENDLDTYTKLVPMTDKMVYVFCIIIIILVFCKGINSTLNNNKNIAVNIHKSVIEEKIKEIEENQKEQESKTNKTLEEIEKIVDGTKREVETLIRVFSGIQR